MYGDGGNLIAMQQYGTVEWTHTDAVTKGQQLRNTVGTWMSRVDVDPWGGETNRSSNSYRQPRKFTTYTRDGNASDEAMHRRYNRWWSRFDQPDPYDGSYDLGDPQSFNRYSYVQNDPVNFVDPTGLLSVDDDHWTNYCFSAANSGCGSGAEMTAFAIDFGLRETFGYAYWDLPGYANEAEQGESRYNAIRSGFDPVLGAQGGPLSNGFVISVFIGSFHNIEGVLRRLDSMAHYGWRTNRHGNVIRAYGPQGVQTMDGEIVTGIIGGAGVGAVLGRVAGVVGGLLGRSGASNAATRAASNFFQGTRYTDKVLMQMRRGDFHSFPELVTNSARFGRVTTIRGGDGVVRQMLEIPGAYKGRQGVFQFIKEADGAINHRLFVPRP